MKNRSNITKKAENLKLSKSDMNKMNAIPQPSVVHYFALFSMFVIKSVRQKGGFKAKLFKKDAKMHICMR